MLLLNLNFAILLYLHRSNMDTLISHMQAVGNRLCQGASLSDVQSEIDQLNDLALGFTWVAPWSCSDVNLAAAILTHRHNMYALNLDTAVFDSLKDKLMANVYVGDQFVIAMQSHSSWDYYGMLARGEI